jgi:hypothetical protein
MTKEQEFEELKAVVLRRYIEYCDVVRNSTLSGLNDFNKRKRLIDAFVVSVDANAPLEISSINIKTLVLPTTKDNNKRQLHTSWDK